MVLCCAPYKVRPIPGGVDLTNGIEILSKKDKPAVAEACDVAARSFAGTPEQASPAEFDWILAGNGLEDKSKIDERVHCLLACQSFQIHFTFALKERGMVLVARNDSDTTNSSNKVIGLAVLAFYPKGWSPNVDGSCPLIQATRNSGGFSWTKQQQDFCVGPRMQSMEKIMKKLHQSHASKPHIHLQILGVSPEHQGKGNGRKLLEAVNMIADAEGLPAYLETTTVEEPFYKQFGYSRRGEPESLAVVEKGSANESVFSGFCCMRREPKGAGVNDAS